MGGLALALEERSLRLLDDPVLLHELEAYQLERLPNGEFRYAAPSALGLLIQQFQNDRPVNAQHHRP